MTVKKELPVNRHFVRRPANGSHRCEAPMLHDSLFFFLSKSNALGMREVFPPRGAAQGAVSAPAGAWGRGYQSRQKPRKRPVSPAGRKAIFPKKREPAFSHPAQEHTPLPGGASRASGCPPPLLRRCSGAVRAEAHTHFIVSASCTRSAGLSFGGAVELKNQRRYPCQKTENVLRR